jgi:hypothetical protein
MTETQNTLIAFEAQPKLHGSYDVQKILAAGNHDVRCYHNGHQKPPRIIFLRHALS